MAWLRADYSGTLRCDAFYMLVPPYSYDYVPALEFPLLKLDSSKVVRAGELYEDPPLEFILHEMCDAALCDCRENHLHVSTYIYLRNRVRMSVLSGSHVPDLLHVPRALGNSCWIVTARVAESLSDSRLRGVELLPIELVENQTKLSKLDGLRYWQTRGRSCNRPFQIHGVPNHCPWCESKPIVCNACGHLDYFCLECHRQILVPSDKAMPDERQVLICAYKERRVEVVDGSRWDGGDTFHLMDAVVISRRVLDRLLSIHAGSFVAEPIAVWTDQMTPQQKELLDDVATPLTA
jgi:hypothetical protein